MADERKTNARPAHGGGRMRGPRPKVENPGKLLKRVLSLIFRHYGWACAGVALCIVGTALATVQGSLFLKSLIDGENCQYCQARQQRTGQEHP